MSLLQAYLRKPSTQRVLSRKPGEKGFSLIELVVVVAVLAILAAIAIPSFTSINDNAAQAAAKNTIAQIAKECAVKKANGETLEFNVPNLNSYDVKPTDGDCGGEGSAGEIYAEAKADASDILPTKIIYETTSGKKKCTAGSADTDYNYCDQNGTW